MSKKQSLLAYFASNFGTVVGLVLIWRGIWYALDGLDMLLFGENHILSSAAGVVIGFLILYLPDRKLQEIHKL